MSYFKSLNFEEMSFVASENKNLFKSFNAELPLNSVVWVTGSEGSGRSVFLKMLHGSIEPSSGHLKINGKSVSDFYFQDLLDVRLRSGYSFDFGGLISNRTLYENMLLPLQYHSFSDQKGCEQRVDYILEKLKITKSSLFDRPANVRGSLRKAICVARAFIFDPELILLDDPTTGLNSVMRTALKEYIVELKKEGNRHMYIATDDIDFITDVVDHTIYLDNAKMAMSLKEDAA